MKIDVVVPYFNQGDYVSETILSLLGQTSNSLGQVILVDDGSNTRVEKSLSSEALSDPRLMVIRSEKNYGESHAVNLGWKYARSRWISVINADDPQRSDWLERMLTFIEKHKEYVFYYPDRLIIDQSGEVLRQERLRNFRRNDLLRSLICVPSSGAIIDTFKLPKEFLPRIESIRYPSDLIQYLNLLRFGNGVRVSNVWGQWRAHGLSQSSTIQQLAKIELFVSSILHWVNQNPGVIACKHAKAACLIHVLRYHPGASLNEKIKFARKMNLTSDVLSIETLSTLLEIFFTFSSGKLLRILDARARIRRVK